MKGQIAQWGNSAAIRIPKPILEDLRIAAGSEVEMWVEGHELRMRAVPAVTSYRLEDLLSQISPDNIPEMEEWPPVGAEIIDDDYSG
ncbi:MULTISPECIES: AbrB/MazE/SpoVT family DNA-binding domain-containing protein [Rhodopseudomonas]|uniref:MazF family transcriptional regulator n=1 Tax=Rhodopseudomonas palustris TaxID=1076 RepID=A0A0D7F0S8_RHOPL|nr:MULTISPECIES: AbrB/MazE/SpoVT family DNA-binding domain-containing protein [Rhodopseudomonas]KIZ46415.1 MazF family transcriptional regulator [Rhodopseudomonas palustris]MDF3808701.1 AbrB/MazE/SpoVT family DNA-binding domain-containing protein [Rhodopseudomonas sp. BAL398]WOK19777.1 AbrB/MazE/SpoVT family DNA-binding domain-containing protein [Rhodopseudomonas sp. BAL398]